MSEMRRSASYRVGVIGIRLACLAPILVVIFVLAGLLDAPKILIKAIILMLVIIVALSLLLFWVAVVPLSRQASILTGSARGQLDIAKSGALIQAILRDALNLRFW
jgi:hypothetical protein